MIYKMIEIELTKKIEALIDKFGEKEVAFMLDVDPRSIENYKTGKPPNKSIKRNISESFDNYITKGLPYKQSESGEEPDYKNKLIILKDTTIKAQEETIKALNIQIDNIKKVSSSDALEILKENNALLHFLVEKLVPLPKGSKKHILLNEKKAVNDKEGK